MKLKQGVLLPLLLCFMLGYLGFSFWIGNSSDLVVTVSCWKHEHGDRRKVLVWTAGGFSEEERVLEKDENFSVLDVSVVANGRFEGALNGVDGIIINAALAQSLCGAQRNEKEDFLKSMTQQASRDKIIAVMVNYTHAKDFPRGYGIFANCLVEMGVKVILFRHLSNIGTVSIASSLIVNQVKMNVKFIPLHKRELENHGSLKRKFDVAIYKDESSLKNPHHRRLLKLVQEMKTISLVVCEESPCFAKARVGIVTSYGDSGIVSDQYYEAAFSGAVMAGEVPIDAEIVFAKDSFVKLEKYMNDEHIEGILEESLKDPAKISRMADRASKKIAQLKLENFPKHVHECLYNLGHVIPPFLSGKRKSKTSHFNVDILARLAVRPCNE